MSAHPAGAAQPHGVFVAELAKLPAFVRRDLLQAWSYRMAFFWDAVGLVFQAFIFFYIGKMVDPDKLPSYGSAQVSYLEFVAVGIAISTFVGLGVVRAASAFRNEQFTGTLEQLLMTPTTPSTIQLGSIVYDLLYMPIRTAVFFLVIVLTLDVNLHAGGAVPAAVTLLLFVPFVWGLGIAQAAATLTFRRGGTSVPLTLLMITSGAYFPLTLFPDWLETIATYNPMSIAITTMRELLLGDSGWPDVATAVAILGPGSALTLVGGVAAFRAAVARERRRGTVGLY